MSGWADDPELLATFRAEVEERLASLTAGLLQLETHPAPRQVVAGMFRDAHTVKGSARMLGLTAVLQVAHRCEDLLGAVRDERLPVRRDVIDLLLAACDGINAALPGGDGAAGDAAAAEAHLVELAAALERAIAGEAVGVPAPPFMPELPAAAPAAAVATAPATEPSAPPVLAEDHLGQTRGDSVRVATGKVYDLLDVVGEAELDARRVERASGGLDALAVEHSRWLRSLRDALGTPSGEAAVALGRLLRVGEQLTLAARDLRELVDDAHGRLAQVRDGAMGLAMVPVRRVVAALPRVVRDVATATGKDVRLVLVGEDVELDKQVLDGVSDALKHLVVNAVDHGCESPAERVAAGKPAQATVTVTARAAGGTVVLDVCDDGRGIDEDAVRSAAIARGVLAPESTATGSALLQVLFLPAFSTSTEVTETSGRGVGLDVVRSDVESLGGSVDLQTTPGAGTTFTVTLPVTLGVLRCLIARVGDERYALPVPGIVESISLKDAAVHSLAGKPVVVRHGATVPLLDLGSALGGSDSGADREAKAAVVVRHGDRQVAWAVDGLDGELELVVKDLGPFLGRLPLVSGATIDGDGSVVFLVDLRELGGDARPAVVVTDDERPAQPGVARPRVLVVEDSVGVRELERVILEGAGYEVVTAVDGLDGAARLKDSPADLVVSDVEMPGMDGFTLTRTIRRTRGWEQVPVIIMTSRGSEDDQRAGLEAGASAYLLKTEFDQNQLVETVRRLVGR
ncbi:MAG TPA: hybrid sensor histidine kinase/response regulator [Mycobacteriales bacterium]|nr:hybrid sensor histidine kinase/response regulator [Mycobacteriales bacterium]